MEYSISTASLVMMAIDLVIAFLVPFVLYFIFRAKNEIKAKPFLFGFLVMFIFNLVLKSIVSMTISQAAGDLMNNLWFYGIVGGLMAGIFEEVGRYLAMRFTLTKFWDNDYNAIGYGLGHGGFELIFILGVTMFSNITIGMMISSGNADVLFANLTNAQDIETMHNSIQLLCSTSPLMFLISPIERAAAYVAQIALSVIVWFGVKSKNNMSLPVAIVLHAVLDAVAVIVYKLSNSYAITETVIWIIAIGIAYYARNIWHQNTQN